MAAVLKLIILVPTAVPKTFEASFDPNDHPKNSPLEMRKANMQKSYRERLIT